MTEFDPKTDPDFASVGSRFAPQGTPPFDPPRRGPRDPPRRGQFDPPRRGPQDPPRRGHFDPPGPHFWVPGRRNSLLTLSEGKKSSLTPIGGVKALTPNSDALDRENGGSNR